MDNGSGCDTAYPSQRALAAGRGINAALAQGADEKFDLVVKGGVAARRGR